MNPVILALVALVVAFCGVTLGRYLAGRLPEHHLQGDSKDVLKLAAGLVTTMLALLLSLQLSSVKASFDAQQTEVTEIAAEVTILDRTLAEAGPGSAAARSTLRTVVDSMVQRTWPAEGHGARIETPPGAAALYEGIVAIQPRTDGQRFAKTNAIALATELGKRVRLLSEVEASSTLYPFIAIEMAWIALVYTIFGLISPSNQTVLVALVGSALAIAVAIYLIVDLSTPFSSIIHIPSTALREALDQIGR